jgi:hypothetical protein
MQLTLLPLLKRLASHITSWIGPKFAEKVYRAFYHFDQVTFRTLHVTYPVIPTDLISYLDADKRPYSFEMIGTEGRPGFPISAGISVDMDVQQAKKNDQIWLSIAVREALPPEYRKGRLLIKATLKDDQGNVQNSGAFEVLNDGTNYLFTHLYGAGWISWYLSLEDVPEDVLRGRLTLTLETKLVPTAGGTSYAEPPHEALFLGFPQVVRHSAKPKKIICISCESLTDPYLLKETFPEQAHLIDPMVFELMEKYSSSTTAYTQGDSTMPSCHAQLTGLLALQHGIGSYNPGPNASNLPVRNEEILSTAQILKRAGFLTFASAMYTALGPYYGCARGFDSYINVDAMGEPRWPDLLNAVIPSLESAPNADSYHYAHFDTLLHTPYVNARSALFSSINDFKNLTDPNRRVFLYINSLNRLFWQLKCLDGYVERHKDKIDFYVQITGDHGHGLDPWWGSHKDYALYEQRIRVPFLSKDFSSNPLPPPDRSIPVSAGVEMFKNALRFASRPLPSEIQSLSQFRPEYQGIAISETIFHPGDDDYCLAISNKDYKYVISLKVDYDARKVKSQSWQRLYEKRNGIPDESLDIASDSPQMVSKFQKIAQSLVEESLHFNARYPARSSLDPTQNWSVNDLRSPSMRNRRPKKVLKTEWVEF